MVSACKVFQFHFPIYAGLPFLYIFNFSPSSLFKPDGICFPKVTILPYQNRGCLVSKGIINLTIACSSDLREQAYNMSRWLTPYISYIYRFRTAAIFINLVVHVFRLINFGGYLYNFLLPSRQKGRKKRQKYKQLELSLLSLQPVL